MSRQSLAPRWFRDGLACQARVVGALMMRELHTRYGRDNIGYLWLIAEPMLLAALVALIHMGRENHYGLDIRPVPFVVIGYTIFMTFRTIVNRADGSLDANAPLMYHRMVTIFDIQLARVLLEAAGTFLTLMILLSLAALIGLADWPARPLALVAGAGFMIWLSMGVSFLATAVTYDNNTAGRFIQPFTYILMPLSGAFFRTEWIPDPYRSWIYWLPTTQIFELARYGQFVAGDDRYFNIGYISFICAALTLFGMLAMRHIRQHIHLR